MQSRERAFHAVSFEVIALAFIVPASALLIEQNPLDMLFVSIALSLFAMLWNYIYNFWFDKLVGPNRITRKLFTRIVHALCFEGGMLIVTIPIVSWYLALSLLDTLILEAGVLTFILIYTAVFNWLYDIYQPYQKCVSKLTKYNAHKRVTP
ncbi:PACE efflux transporter [Shewanella polaris]|uniref:PACE efflux transporter n=1 Tax=Shewanella polaris TaxID=2588449 RepID=A0A4Y5YFL3_9GAMM|nr:PACE efflux transporter [Shewanella polaris]QDE31408.1 PACE efflux transporter [Shewanella polaris]